MHVCCSLSNVEECVSSLNDVILNVKLVVLYVVLYVKDHVHYRLKFGVGDIL